MYTSMFIYIFSRCPFNDYVYKGTLGTVLCNTGALGRGATMCSSSSIYDRGPAKPERALLQTKGLFKEDPIYIF